MHVPVTDEEAVQAFEYLARCEGIIPAIESAHAVAHAMKIAPAMTGDQDYRNHYIRAEAIKTVPPSPVTEEKISMSNIRKAFENGKAFIAFITCGDPDLETTAAAVRAAEKTVPISSNWESPSRSHGGRPCYPGRKSPRIKRRRNYGQNFQPRSGSPPQRKDPLVFMTYANVIFSYGSERFISACADSGIDGLILPDLPFEEKKSEFSPICQKYGVDLISLIAPTSKKIVPP